MSEAKDAQDIVKRSIALLQGISGATVRASDTDLEISLSVGQVPQLATEMQRQIAAALPDDPELALLKALYEKLRLLVNFFYPSMKLLEKSRVDGRIRKRYDLPKTPASRLLECSAVSPVTKRLLRAQLSALDPILLSRQISRIQRQLLSLVKRKGLQVLYPGPAYPAARERMRAHLFAQR